MGGAFPDIVEPKEADVVEDEERKCRERVVDEAANLDLSLLTLVVGLVKIKSTAHNISPSFSLFSLH